MSTSSILDHDTRRLLNTQDSVLSYFLTTTSLSKILWCATDILLRIWKCEYWAGILSFRCFTSFLCLFLLIQSQKMTFSPEAVMEERKTKDTKTKIKKKNFNKHLTSCFSVSMVLKSRKRSTNVIFVQLFTQGSYTEEFFFCIRGQNWRTICWVSHINMYDSLVWTLG